MSNIEIIEQLKTILKTRKEQKEIIECAGGYCGNCNPDIQALSQAIETVLSELEKKECKYIRQDNDWIVYQCSNCEMDWVFEDDEPKDSEINYCPKCGAKITEVVELVEEE